MAQLWRSSTTGHVHKVTNEKAHSAFVECEAFPIPGKPVMDANTVHPLDWCLLCFPEKVQAPMPIEEA